MFVPSCSLSLSVFHNRKPWVCGISSLGIDHTQILGDTIEKIAWQKGGIFKVCWYILEIFHSVFLHNPWVLDRLLKAMIHSCLHSYLVRTLGSPSEWLKMCQWWNWNCPEVGKILLLSFSLLCKYVSSQGFLLSLSSSRRKQWLYSRTGPRK